MRIDLHIHTEYSDDSSLSLDSLILAYDRRRIDCVAITDHNTIEAALRLKERMGWRVIVGEEIRTLDGEIIGLFLQKKISPFLSPEKTISLIREQGGLVYIPHPFDRLRRSRLKAYKLLELVTKVDIIEAFNSGTAFNSDNREAFDFAKSRNLVYGVGSDAHSEFEVGRAFVEMKEFNSPQEFLKNLRSARFFGKKTPFLVKALSRWIKYI